MKTSTHIYTTAGLAAALYAHSHSFPEAAACFAGGNLIDFDHIPDFFLFSGEKFSWNNFVSWCTEERWQKVTIVFHSYELLALLCVVAYYLDSAPLRGMLWGAGLHLLLDQIGNVNKFRLSPWFYFLGFRIAGGFKRENLQIAALK